MALLFEYPVQSCLAQLANPVQRFQSYGYAVLYPLHLPLDHQCCGIYTALNRTRYTMLDMPICLIDQISAPFLRQITSLRRQLQIITCQSLTSDIFTQRMPRKQSHRCLGIRHKSIALSILGGSSFNATILPTDLSTESSSLYHERL